jgi:hypothetical protein
VTTYVTAFLSFEKQAPYSSDFVLHKEDIKVLNTNHICRAALATSGNIPAGSGDLGHGRLGGEGFFPPPHKIFYIKKLGC